MKNSDNKVHFLQKKNVSKNIFVFSILFYPMLLFLIFYVGVNFTSFLLAFQKIDLYGNITWTLFGNFKDYLAQLTSNGTYLSMSLFNSLKMYAINLVVCMPLYIFFSYMLFLKFRGHSVLRSIVMVPAIVSGLVMCLVFKKFIDVALPNIAKSVFNLDSFPVLLDDARYSFGVTLFYMIWISFSTSLIVYPNAMKDIPEEIFESAHLDGLNNMFQELRYIVLPLIFPTLSTFLITGFAGILSQGGPIMEFYMFEAPLEVYNMGYYYLSAVKNSTTYQTFPVLAAGGLLMTLLVAPSTHLLKHLLEKYGPETEY